MTAALVVLRPRGDVAEVTAATREEWQPDPEGVERVRRAFAELGFEVGAVVGLSFSIAGPPELFARLFPDSASKEGTGQPFDLSRVPQVADRVHAVVSEAPPAFGPGNP